MPKYRLLLMGLLIIGMVLSGCGEQKSESEQSTQDQAAKQIDTNKNSNQVTDLTDANWMVGDFEFTDQNGQAFGSKDLKGDIWLANFIFTSCQMVCPPMTANLRQVQQKIDKAGVDIDIVSFSVNPSVDTPKKMKQFGKDHHADFSNWHFLTGYDFKTIKNFSETHFKSAVSKPPEGSSQFTHGTSFYLVNRDGKIIKKYNGYQNVPYDTIIADLKQLAEK
ncbi:SCO family protein [Tuberibacillus sp. Marseille-P3662]|uniref:SCO family protein n=1 Tax=Tuberibacillus sp. Marseille-P3662 TaxID=1965358 RepID=UPI00159429A4|nr:SCO family protein [Tuberibacillus sp. Marseille-P3662]